MIFYWGSRGGRGRLRNPANCVKPYKAQRLSGSCRYGGLWLKSATPNEAASFAASRAAVWPGVHCTVYSVQCTVYSVQCTVYGVQCTLYLKVLHAVVDSVDIEEAGNLDQPPHIV